MSELGFTQPIAISILCLAGFVYYRLVFAKLTLKKSSLAQLNFWQHTLQLCICALPLLGLLGTIMGLLEAFVAMALGDSINGQNELTSGISSALFTTQLGLMFAIPAWLLFASVNRNLQHQQLAQTSHDRSVLAENERSLEKGTLNAG